MVSKHKYGRICIPYGIKNHEILITITQMVLKKKVQYRSNTALYIRGNLVFVTITSIEGNRKDKHL